MSALCRSKMSITKKNYFLTCKDIAEGTTNISWCNIQYVVIYNICYIFNKNCAADSLFFLATIMRTNVIIDLCKDK